MADQMTEQEQIKDLEGIASEFKRLGLSNLICALKTGTKQYSEISYERVFGLYTKYISLRERLFENPLIDKYSEELEEIGEMRAEIDGAIEYYSQLLNKLSERDIQGEKENN